MASDFFFFFFPDSIYAPGPLVHNSRPLIALDEIFFVGSFVDVWLTFHVAFTFFSKNDGKKNLRIHVSVHSSQEHRVAEVLPTQDVYP